MLNFMLTPVRGPACPECGCRDTHVLRPPQADSWWGQGQAQCRHCGGVFRFAMDAQESVPKPSSAKGVVRRMRLRCPVCASPEVRALSTRAQKSLEGQRVQDGWVLRYMKCLACGHRFKTIEE